MSLLKWIFSRFEFVVFVDECFLVIRVRPQRRAIRLKILDENNQEITMAVTISADKKRVFSVAPVDSKGRPAQIDGIPEWSVSPTGGVRLFPSTNGLSCEVAWFAPMSGQVVTIKADADLGAGVEEIFGSVDVVTLSAKATGFAVTVGEETDI